MSLPKNLKCGKCTGRKFKVRTASKPEDSTLICERCGTITGRDYWKQAAKRASAVAPTASRDMTFSSAANAANGREATFVSGGLPGLGRRS
jgi:hypothetical protein